jgi:hypothetical protein
MARCWHALWLPGDRSRSRPSTKVTAPAGLSKQLWYALNRLMINYWADVDRNAVLRRMSFICLMHSTLLATTGSRESRRSALSTRPFSRPSPSTDRRRSRAFGLQGPRSIAETDSAVEGDGFELPVPLRWSVFPNRPFPPLLAAKPLLLEVQAYAGSPTTPLLACSDRAGGRYVS